MSRMVVESFAIAARSLLNDVEKMTNA